MIDKCIRKGDILAANKIMVVGALILLITTIALFLSIKLHEMLFVVNVSMFAFSSFLVMFGALRTIYIIETCPIKKLCPYNKKM